MKYLSLFSGIGAFEKAMINLDIPFDLVGYSEIDKYASKSYSEIYGVSEDMNLGDITKIDESTLPKVDLITYGFPCQDISLAGKQKGLFNEDGTKTRSGLFFDALRIIDHCKPKVAIAENVKNLTSKKFNEQFNIVLDSLEESGYNNYWKVLNAKNYGIPQNRERVFIVSIRKDIDNGKFEFPATMQLTTKLKDLLEAEVDEKYYISDERIHKIKHSNFSQEKSRIQESDICGTLLARDYKDPKCVYVKVANKKGYDEAVVGDSINLEQPTSKTRRGRVGHGIAQTLNTGSHQAVVVNDKQHGSTYDYYIRNSFKQEAKGNGFRFSPHVKQNANIAKTVTTKSGTRMDDNFIIDVDSEKDVFKFDSTNDEITKENISTFRVRKLTPKECFRLMGFDDSDFNKCSCSNTQLYKQAGNSIVVDVAEEILCMLFDNNNNFYIERR